MGNPAARVGDNHSCPMSNHVGGPISGPGAKNVFIGGMPAARIGDSAVCTGATDFIVQGAINVKIEGMPAARMNDATMHGGMITIGEPNVCIGGPSMHVKTEFNDFSDADLQLMLRARVASEIDIRAAIELLEDSKNEIHRLVKYYFHIIKLDKNGLEDIDILITKYKKMLKNIDAYPYYSQDNDDEDCEKTKDKYGRKVTPLAVARKKWGTRSTVFCMERLQDEHRTHYLDITDPSKKEEVYDDNHNNRTLTATHEQSHHDTNSKDHAYISSDIAERMKWDNLTKAQRMENAETLADFAFAAGQL